MLADLLSFIYFIRNLKIHRAGREEQLFLGTAPAAALELPIIRCSLNASLLVGLMKVFPKSDLKLKSIHAQFFLYDSYKKKGVYSRLNLQES